MKVGKGGDWKLVLGKGATISARIAVFRERVLELLVSICPVVMLGLGLREGGRQGMGLHEGQHGAEYLSVQNKGAAKSAVPVTRSRLAFCRKRSSAAQSMGRSVLPPSRPSSRRNSRHVDT